MALAPPFLNEPPALGPDGGGAGDSGWGSVAALARAEGAAEVRAPVRQTPESLLRSTEG